MLVVTYAASEAQMRQAQDAGTVKWHREQVKIWDVKSGREMRTLNLGNTAVEASFSSDGRLLATREAWEKPSLWDMGSGSKVRDLTSSPLANSTK